MLLPVAILLFRGTTKIYRDWLWKSRAKFFYREEKNLLAPDVSETFFAQQYSRNLLKLLGQSEDIRDVFRIAREHEGSRNYDTDGPTRRWRSVGQG